MPRRFRRYLNRLERLNQRIREIEAVPEAQRDTQQRRELEELRNERDYLNENLLISNFGWENSALDVAENEIRRLERIKQRTPEQNEELNKLRRGRDDLMCKFTMTRREFIGYMTAGILGLLGFGTLIGYKIWGKRGISNSQKIAPKKPPLNAKTLDDLVGNFYSPEEVRVSIGENPYGEKRNILHVKARGPNEILDFSIFETDITKFNQLAYYFDYISKAEGAFEIPDPLEKNTGYPRDFRNGIQFGVERSAEDLPVYKIAGDDVLFYVIFKRPLKDYLGR
ncbi:MAG: hypothetical protein QXQ40_00260 [Candidatus Aenigmatarchaeota archaeon]